MSRCVVKRLVTFVFLVAASWSAPATAQIESETVFSNLQFESPVGFESYGPERLYVVERLGKIQTFLNEPGVEDKELFLDITELVHTESIEEGLLGLAFHPNYDENGYFYVYYTASPTRNLLVRYERDSEDPTRADPESETVLLTVPQPETAEQNKHNGGDLAFGPDGYLYASVGDGGYYDDQYEKNYPQDLTNLLGSIIRIDVDGSSEDRAYAIPPDNPLAGNDQGFREEIYAWGFRNPWRFSIDDETGALWVGGVGEATWEEIQRIEKGDNAGWPILEGRECFLNDDCDRSKFTSPVIVYEHGVKGSSVTGGYVYRGKALSELRGKYVFADWQSNSIWTLEEEDGESVMSQPHTRASVSSFGEDADGELYMTSYFNGEIYKITGYTRSVPTTRPPIGKTDVPLRLDGPNPFHHSTTLTFTPDTSNHAHLAVYDATGRRVRVLFDGSPPAGVQQRVRFKAGDLSAGVYFVRLQIGNGSNVVTQTQPVVLMR